MGELLHNIPTAGWIGILIFFIVLGKLLEIMNSGDSSKKGKNK